MDPQVAQELEKIRTRLAKLEGLVPDYLADDMRVLHGILDDLPIAADAATTNTPTATGYIPFIVNGKRINLMTGS